MNSVSIAQIEEQLRQLPPEKLAVVFDFVLYLVEKQLAPDLLQAMNAAESALAKDWLRAEEEAAWADL